MSAAAAAEKKKFLDLLNKKGLFTVDDLAETLKMIQQNPDLAKAVGRHGRSTIWICAQNSSCPFRRRILPELLISHGADVNKKAGNGNTVLHSLYTAWKKKNNKYKRELREMARDLAEKYHATVPNNDRNGIPSPIQEWLTTERPQLNYEVLE